MLEWLLMHVHLSIKCHLDIFVFKMMIYLCYDSKKTRYDIYYDIYADKRHNYILGLFSVIYFLFYLYFL